MSKYTIILPTLNEGENIHIILFLIFEQAKKNKIDIKVVIVDDNSSDDTRSIIE